MDRAPGIAAFRQARRVLVARRGWTLTDQCQQRKTRLCTKHFVRQLPNCLRDRVVELEHDGPITHAEAELLQVLADLRQAIAGRVDGAGDLGALRRLLHELFESVYIDR